MTKAASLTGILIDPFTRTVSAISLPTPHDYRNIYRVIACELFDAVRIGDGFDSIFVDDEGLLKPAEGQAYFMFDGLPNPLAGKGLVLGVDDEGEDVSPAITLEQVAAKVEWIDPLTQDEADQLASSMVFMAD